MERDSQEKGPVAMEVQYRDREVIVVSKGVQGLCGIGKSSHRLLSCYFCSL